MTGKDTPIKTPEETTTAENAITQDNQKPAKQANWAMRILVVLVIFLLGSGAALYTLPTLKNRLPILAKWVGEGHNNVTTDLSDNPQIRELRQKLEQQTAKIAQLQAQDNLPDQGASVISEQTVKLQERLEKLEQAIIKLQEIPQDTTQAARIDRLDQRTNQLELSVLPLSKGLLGLQTAQLDRARLASIMTEQEKQIKQIEDRLHNVEAYSARDNNGALIIFQIAKLRRKVDSGQSFVSEIEHLKAMINKGSLGLDVTLQKMLEGLEAYKEGIMSQDQLTDQFDGLIPTLIRTQSNNDANPWWKNAYYNLKNIIIIRQTNDATTDSPDYIISHIQKALKRHDLPKAVAQIGHLPTAMKAATETWLDQAKAYLSAQAKLDHIETVIMDQYVSKPKQKQIPEQEGIPS